MLHLDENLPLQVDTGMSQLNPVLWKLIAVNHLIPPSKEDYNLENLNVQPSYGQAQTIAQLFENKVWMPIAGKGDFKDTDWDIYLFCIPPGAATHPCDTLVYMPVDLRDPL